MTTRLILAIALVLVEMLALSGALISTNGGF